MSSFDKIAVCDSKYCSLYDNLTELGYSCVRTRPDAVSITSAMLNSKLSAFAADTGSIGKDELLKVFCFFKNIEHYAPCFIITSEPSAFDEFGFVHCCRRE